MAERGSYEEYLKQDLGDVIESLELNDLQKHALRSRWLDQVIWMGGRANHARERYYSFRLTTIIGGIIIPALVSLNLSAEIAVYVRWVTFAISLTVAISAAVEEFFHYGDRWRNYRQSAELLKIDGWNFFQLSGPYRRYDSHAEAYPRFAARVENLIEKDLQTYITQIVAEKEEREQAEEDQ